MANAKRDENFVPTLIGVSSVDGITPITVYVDPVTHRLKVDLAAGSGTVTSVSVVSANGFAGTVATATSTPAITLSTTVTGILQGNGTAISAASTTGSGAVVLANTPTLITPVLGAATGTSVSLTSFVAVTPSTDTISGVFRRNGVAQTANIIEIQTEANALLAGFDKTGKLSVPNVNVSGLTASQIVITDGSSNLASATVATYPSLTELAYVKGVTSAIQTQIDALTGAVVLKGTWDASAGTFPGGGVAQAGWSYIVSVGGTVDGIAFTANDRIVAITNNASTTTYAANWFKLDYTDQVLSVAGKTGNVVLETGDITSVATNRILGRNTAGVGVAEELTGSTVRDITGLDTDDSPQFTAVNIGHATDTTLARVSAGVLSVEGVTIPTISSTSTLTNKRVNPRTASSTTDANLTPDLSSANVYYRTTQTGTLAINAPIGTPVIGETIMIYIDSAGAQTVNFNATYKIGRAHV